MSDTRVDTGITGLNAILDGGLLPERTYMVRGPPGAGKTLVGLNFLERGIETDEEALFIALEENKADIIANAASVNIDVSEASFLDLAPGSDYFESGSMYDIFAADEVEGETIVNEITTCIDNEQPDRIVLDPITQFRYLAPDDYQFRRHVLSFLKYLRDQHATVLLTSQARTTNDELEFLSDGVITLERTEHTRQLYVPKYRGSSSRGGKHTYRISGEGISVFPELEPSIHGRKTQLESISTGVPSLDTMLHGGIERGTTTIISGPSGVGKTTLGTQFMKEGANRGERSVIFLFEENKDTFFHRAEATNTPVSKMVDRGTLSVYEIEPLQMSAGEFDTLVRQEVEDKDTELVMIDGIAGYRLSLTDENTTVRRKLHSLCRYLRNMGVSVILIDQIQSITGDLEPTSENISYLADNIMFIRYLELQGELKKATGVLKKRTSDFERALREFEITAEGIKVGAPLSELRGILKGTPEWVTYDQTKSSSTE